MKRPRLFAEIPAGLASVSLVLQGGKHCKPPVSRMGNKHGYAGVILDAMGLRPGQGSESYLWCEADPDVRNLLVAYTQPALLRAVADVLRGWKDEEPRALWTRLRDERRARKAALPLDQSVAEWMFLHHGSFSGKDIEGGIGRPQGAGSGDCGPDFTGSIRPSLDIVHDAAERLATGPGWPPVAVTSSAPSVEEVAGWLAYVARSHHGSGGFCPPFRQATPAERADGHTVHTYYQPDAPASAVDRLAALPWPRTCITSRAPTAEEVAGWLVVAGGSMMGLGNGAFGGNLEGWENGEHGNGTSKRPLLARLPESVDRLAKVSARPTEPTPGVDLEGCVVYMDPDYVGTTGYAATMPRAEVVRLATSYAAAGALVVVSEAVAIPELTVLGWEAVDIAGERRGQKRTFSKEQGEWITMSRPPVNRPSIQHQLFGAP